MAKKKHDISTPGSQDLVTTYGALRDVQLILKDVFKQKMSVETGLVLRGLLRTLAESCKDGDHTVKDIQLRFREAVSELRNSMAEATNGEVSDADVLKTEEYFKLKSGHDSDIIQLFDKIPLTVPGFQKLPWSVLTATGAEFSPEDLLRLEVCFTSDKVD